MPQEPPAPQLRDMTAADLAGGLQLSRASGWNQTLEDWRLLLSLGPGLFQAAVRGSTVVASGGAVRYGDALAWICMILVHPDERGRGLGTRVFEAVLARCTAEATAGRLRCIGLDATPAGRPLYRQHDFVDGPGLARMGLEHSLGDGIPDGVHAMQASELDAVLARDRRVFGADRGRVLHHALDAAPELAFVAGRAGHVAGYCFGRQGDHSTHVGPVVADDRETALGLVRACAARPRHRALTLDARAEPNWLEALQGLGFRVQRPLTRMYLGKARPDAEPALEPVVFGPEFG